MIDTMVVIIGFILLAMWITSILIMSAGFLELVIWKNKIEQKEILIASWISLAAFAVSTYFLFFFKF